MQAREQAREQVLEQVHTEKQRQLENLVQALEHAPLYSLYSMWLILICTVLYTLSGVWVTWALALMFLLRAGTRGTTGRQAGRHNGCV